MSNDAALKFDVECTKCGRLMALCNAFRDGHHYLCPNCAPTLEEVINRFVKETDND